MHIMLASSFPSHAAAMQTEFFCTAGLDEIIFAVEISPAKRQCCVSATYCTRVTATKGNVGIKRRRGEPSPGFTYRAECALPRRAHYSSSYQNMVLCEEK